jgi:hypothetical protein
VIHDIAELIHKINKMTLDDTEYAPTYYSILALDQTGNAINFICPPKQAGWNSNGQPQTLPHEPPKNHPEHVFDTSYLPKQYSSGMT